VRTFTVDLQMASKHAHTHTRLVGLDLDWQRGRGGYDTRRWNWAARFPSPSTAASSSVLL
jgi:hypothetical protein